MAQLVCATRPVLLSQATHGTRHYFLGISSKSSKASQRESRETLMATIQEIVKGILLEQGIRHFPILGHFSVVHERFQSDSLGICLTEHVGGSSVQCLFFDEIREKRRKAVADVQNAYKISNEELDHALKLGERAIREYLQASAASSSEERPETISEDFKSYISNQLNDYKIPAPAVHLSEKWMATPAALEWDIGTAFGSDGKLDDAKVFTIQLSVSKLWRKILDDKSMKAIVDHEIAHLGQNSENLETHMLRALIDEKEQLSPASDNNEKKSRKEAWKEYLYWTEYSADQVPALKSLDKAKGMKHFLGSLLMSVEVFNSPFHPANWRRKGSVQDILSSLEAEHWLKSKKFCRNCEDFKHCQTDRSYYDKHHA